MQHRQRVKAAAAAASVFALCGAGIAAAQTPAPAGTVPPPLWQFISTYQALFGGVFGAGLGYVTKWFFDQRSAEMAARRRFAEAVTSQISDLSRDHYWSLANCAGVLAGLLEGYLDNRTFHLMLLWPDRAELQKALDNIAKESADESFFYFCRLIALFDEFQFQGSNTYLLTSIQAGETCKRLYNAFIGTLPGSDGINTLRIACVMRELRPTRMSEEDIRIADFPSDLFREIAGNELKAEREAYRRWIRSHEPSVSDAAHALRAYNELLSHELSRLYRGWFRQRIPERNPYLTEVAYDTWPNLLTEQSFAAIQRASGQSALLRPLGTPSPLPKALDAQAEQASTDQQGPAQQSGRPDHKQKLDPSLELIRLLEELFDPPELQRVLRHREPLRDVVNQIEWSGAKTSVMASVVRQIQKHGFVSHLFDAVLAVRGGHDQRIQALKVEYQRSEDRKHDRAPASEAQEVDDA